jgi:hypothetical protein
MRKLKYSTQINQSRITKELTRRGNCSSFETGPEGPD